MILLKNIRDFIATLNVAEDENCYSGILPNKPMKAIGVYNLQRRGAPDISSGNCSTYEEKGISLLIHWNKSPAQTETAAIELFNKLINFKKIKNDKATINNNALRHIKLLCKEPISVGTDDAGIYEYVIECIFYVDKEEIR